MSLFAKWMTNKMADRKSLLGQKTKPKERLHAIFGYFVCAKRVCLAKLHVVLKMKSGSLEQTHTEYKT